MNAMTTFLDRLFTAATCIVGWAVFPMFIALGAIALFLYAFIAEILAPAGEPASIASRPLANPAATGIHLRQTLQP